MKQHNDQPLVQTTGCCLIGNLSWRLEGVRENALYAGGMTAVLNAMKTCKQDSIVQEYGFCALFTLVHAESTFIQAVVDAGGIEAVVAAMERHPASADLQSGGCEFWTALAKSHGDYRKSIIGARGLTAVAEARRVHQDNKAVVRKAKAAAKAILRSSCRCVHVSWSVMKAQLDVSIHNDERRQTRGICCSVLFVTMEQFLH